MTEYSMNRLRSAEKIDKMRIITSVEAVFFLCGLKMFFVKKIANERCCYNTNDTNNLTTFKEQGTLKR